MLPPRFQKFLISRDFIIRKDWVKYLVLVNWHAQQFENVLKQAADEGFTKFVEGEVHNYLNGTTPPPESIQSAVLNVADDVASGREVVLRAGDYIALRNYYMEKTGH